MLLALSQDAAVFSLKKCLPSSQQLAQHLAESPLAQKLLSGQVTSSSVSSTGEERGMRKANTSHWCWERAAKDLAMSLPISPCSGCFSWATIPHQLPAAVAHSSFLRFWLFKKFSAFSSSPVNTLNPLQWQTQLLGEHPANFLRALWLRIDSSGELLFAGILTSQVCV